MGTLQEAAAEFLASDHIAVVGVSRDTRGTANAIYRKLKGGGAHVVPVNGRARELEGDACYPDLKSIPGGVSAVLVVAPRKTAVDIVQQCADLGVRQVWIHGTFGCGAASPEAVALGREKGIRVIAGACPMMFHAPVDGAHRFLRTIWGWFGRLPRVD